MESMSLIVGLCASLSQVLAISSASKYFCTRRASLEALSRRGGMVLGDCGLRFGERFVGGRQTEKKLLVLVDRCLEKRDRGLRAAETCLEGLTGDLKRSRSTG